MFDHEYPSTFGHLEIDYFYKKSVLESPIQNFNVITDYLKGATPELVALDLLEYLDHAGVIISPLFSQSLLRY